jgi:hypothetical protein
MKSARPQRDDIIGLLSYIADGVEEVLRERGDALMNAAEAERALGYKPGHLSFSRYPWRMPGYGLAGKLHTRRSWEEWLKKLENERRIEWDGMSISERRKAMVAA